MIALLATLTVGIYLVYGSPDLPDQPLSARLSPDGNPPIETLVARVEERLRSHPGGWHGSGA